MTCVINLPKHFSNWQGSVFQPRQLLLDLMTNRGSPVKSGNKYYQGPTLQRNAKKIIETRIYVYIFNKETELIFVFKSQKKKN
jgi:hypothetical protein